MESMAGHAIGACTSLLLTLLALRDGGRRDVRSAIARTDRPMARLALSLQQVGLVGKQRRRQRRSAGHDRAERSFGGVEAVTPHTATQRSGESSPGPRR